MPPPYSAGVPRFNDTHTAPVEAAAQLWSAIDRRQISLPEDDNTSGPGSNRLEEIGQLAIKPAPG